MHSATKRQAVAVALRRPNESAIGGLCMWCSGERGLFPKGCAMSLLLGRARRRSFSLDCWGPRETPSRCPSPSWSRMMEGREWMAACARTNSPPTVMVKSWLPKRTCAPGTQLTLWLAIRGLVWNAQRPLPGAPTVDVSNKHQLVNLYCCALGSNGVLKDTRFILVRAE